MGWLKRNLPSTKRPAPATPPQNDASMATSKPRPRELSIHNVFIAAVLAFVTACLLYSPTLSAKFAFDDERGVVTNPDVRVETPWLDLIEHDFWGTPMDAARSHKSYRPLTIASFKATNVIFGMDPYYFHAGNILIHAVVCALFTIYTLSNLDPLAGGLASAVFTFHPVHTEAVANIVGRAELLSGMFFLLALMAFQLCKRSRPLLSLVPSVLFAVLGLLSKEQAITALVVAGVYDVLVHHDVRPNQLLSRSFYLADTAFRSLWPRALSLLTSFALILAYRFSLNHGGKPLFNAMEIPAAFADFWPRVLTQNYYVVFAFRQLAYPFYLCHDWSHNSIPLVETPFDPRVIAIIVFYSAVIGGLMWLVFQARDSDFSKRAILCVAIAIITFIPSANLLVTVGFVVAERVLYLPSMGICMLFGCILAKTCPKRIALAAAAVIVGAFTLQVMARCDAWQDDYSLHEAGYKVNPGNVKLATNLGLLKGERGLDASRPEMERRQYIEEAETLYKAAIAMGTQDASPHLNYGNLLALMGQTDKAVEILNEGLERQDPTRSTLRICNALGTIYFKQKNYEAAEKMFKASTEMDQHHSTAFNGLGVLHAEQQQYDQAVKAFTRAANLDPYNAEIYFNRGTALYYLKKYDDCVADLQQAVKLKPDYATAVQQLKVVTDWLKSTRGA
eukprot:TRINITY_DN9712_c0_g1_i1.p1 TRINITY_DN9712_c0_g1~~TRINITY_DN9712_c0_g1_i1.p1  ORF type:complete len:676 (+),score=86.87 TRINITY_DN9712_c0_g1_i1:65-2092(+)